MADADSGGSRLTDPRQNAHHLIDRLPEAQLAALVGLLETIVDPVATGLRNAPVDDEPETEEEKQAVARSKEWFRHNAGTPFEQVVAELGFTMEQVGNHAQEEEKDPAA
ncbi:MAG: hypothetical protein ABSE35_00210 [Bryobacteraceae bacterium]